MKTLVLGDTHGHNSWRDVIMRESFDKVVFLGDYVDSFSLNPSVIAENLKELIKLKEQLRDRLVLIYGNHDHSYLFGERCSGWNRIGHWMYKPLLDEMWGAKMFELTHLDGNIIYSHAGVSDYWMHEVAQLESVADINFEKVRINLLDWNTLKGYDGYGDTISQSPIWIRPKSLLKSKVDGYRQIVGHTHFRTPVEEQGIYFNDMMPHHYIVVENGNIKFVEL